MSESAWVKDLAARERARIVSRRMSLEEKVALLSNRQRLCSDLGTIRAADGAAGIRLVPGVTVGVVSTALPAPIALAAGWDVDLASEYGEVLGRELRGTGHQVLFGPAVDIARVPLGGRTFESSGEDPMLTAQIVAPEIIAIQGQGAQACVKHFLVNNQENARATVDVRVSEGVLRELYFPPFEAAVRAGVAAVMSSYNRINGTYASDSLDLITGILRDEWGFAGWVVSDYLANHSTVDSFRAGLDWELTDEPEWGEHLIEAVRSGKVAVADIDERLQRVLVPYFAFGQDTPGPTLTCADLRRHHEVARRAAIAGTVLLSNDGTLPLDPRTARVAVIGPDAASCAAAGGGSPLVAGNPALGSSVVDGLRRVLPEADVRWAPGTEPISSGVLLPGRVAVPSSRLRDPDGNPGAAVTFWPTVDFTGDPVWHGTLPTIEMNRGYFSEPGFHAASSDWVPWPALVPARHSSRWEGFLDAPASGEYELAVTFLGLARLWLDDELVLDVRTPVDSRREIAEGILWDGAGALVRSVPLALKRGQQVGFRLDYATDLPEQSGHYGAQLRFGWRTPPDVQPDREQDAADLARWSDVAFVVARAYETEAMDRLTTILPQGQDALISAVAATGTPTVVITMSGGAVDVSSWRTAVAAHLHAWYPGQAQGEALGALVIGASEPTGRLPLTFPATAVARDDFAPEVYPGVGRCVEYVEGTKVGYRSPDECAYPFGFGIGYASIEIADVRLMEDLSAGSVRIAFRARNEGPRAGTEVVQVYRCADRDQPMQLLAWTRVEVEAQGAVDGIVELDDRIMSTAWRRWDSASRTWVGRGGRRRVMVGRHARECLATFDLG